MILIIVLTISLCCNVFLVGLLLYGSRKSNPATIIQSQQTLTVARRSSRDNEHLHYLWRDPETNEVCYYGITSKDDVLKRFDSDARNALNQIRRFMKIREWNERGLSPIIEVYATSNNFGEAHRKEQQDIRDGIRNGEPLLNSENNSASIKMRMRAEVRLIDTPSQ